MKLEKLEVPPSLVASESPKKEKIHIGLVLAGAVTAGAYTAGVLDYLLNTLDCWQAEYDKNEIDKEGNRKVAEPNVIIDAITGASAGSIVAAVTLLALSTKRYENVKDANQQETGKNLLFDTWVNLGLQPGKSMTDKLFSDTDLKEGVKSILNTDWITDLIAELMKDWHDLEKNDLPAYINKELKVLMTLSNLRGIPLELSFSSGSGAIAHTMSYHKAFAYFKLNKKQDDPDKTTLPLDLKDPGDVRLLLECSRASGAFPIGLKSVPFSTAVPKEYIEANLDEIFNGAKINARIEEPYNFMAVDGGMTNNEPIAEAIRILNPRHKTPPLGEKITTILNDGVENKIPAEKQIASIYEALKVEKRANKPIIMIDPFPNYSFPVKKPTPLTEDQIKEKYLNDALMQVVPKLYETLRNQVLFKESDIGDLFSNDSQKGMIWPTRAVDKNNYRNAIASAALGGFAGFFRREFLKHDYMLGQKNCRSFLRNYFYAERKNSDWPSAMQVKFAFPSEDGKESLPIIPDFRIPPKDVVDEEILVGVFPQVKFDDLITKDLQPNIERRVSAVLDILIEDINKAFKKPIETKPKESKSVDDKMKAQALTETEKAIHPWVIQPKRDGSWIPSFVRKFAINLIIRKAKKTIKHELSVWITNQIILELSKHGLFENDPQPTDNIMRKEAEDNLG